MHRLQHLRLEGRESGNHLGCTQNATAGEEYRRGWHPERFEPAANARPRRARRRRRARPGWSARSCSASAASGACTSSRPSAEIGGIMRWVPQLARARRVGARPQLARDPAREAPERRGDHRDAASAAEDVREYGAELVVVATGSHWAGDGLNVVTHEPIPGADASLPHVLTPEQVMLEGKRPPGERVVVYDAEGYFMARGARREARARRAIEVELVTPHERDRARLRRDARGAAAAPAPARRRHPHARAASRLERIETGRVAASRRVRRAVRARGRRGRARHAAALGRRALPRAEGATRTRSPSEGIEAVYRIGDCVAPRIIADAIFDGHRLAREIDSENPAVPLPYTARAARARRRPHCRPASAAPGCAEKRNEHQDPRKRRGRCRWPETKDRGNAIPPSAGPMR